MQCQTCKKDLKPRSKWRGPQKYCSMDCWYKRNSLKTYHTFANQHNGKCLAVVTMDHYGARCKWKCAHGHIWIQTFSEIRRGRWCRKCSGIKQANGIDACTKLAIQNKGKCLSAVYTTALTKYQWECSKGHHFSMTYNNVQQGTWCPLCNFHIGYHSKR